MHEEIDVLRRDVRHGIAETQGAKHDDSLARADAVMTQAANIQPSGALARYGDKPCPLCGASAEHQRVVHGLQEIEQARDAAHAEAEKIRLQGQDLDTTLADLDQEGRAIAVELERLERELARVET